MIKEGDCLPVVGLSWTKNMTIKGLQAHPAVEKFKDFSPSASLREFLMKVSRTCQTQLVMVKVILSTYYRSKLSVVSKLNRFKKTQQLFYIYCISKIGLKS